MSSREEIMEWSRELTIKLIKELEQRRCLWDRRDKFYKNKTVKRKHLKEIAWNLRVDEAEIDKKLMTLKTQYHRELTRIIKSKRSGCPPDEVYVSKWYGFRHLDFLMNTTKPGINLRKTYLQEAVMHPEVIPEPHISSYQGSNGKSMEDVIAVVDLNFVESASRNNSYSVEDPAMKVGYICGEDSISYAEPLHYRASSSTDEAESACGKELPFAQPLSSKRLHPEEHPAIVEISSKDSWLNKNDINIVQPLAKRVPVTRESEAEEGLHFGQFSPRRKAFSERTPASSVMNSGENAPVEEGTRFAQPLPRRRTDPGRNLVLDHVCSCRGSKVSKDIHSYFSEYVAHELRTLHDPLALLQLKKKITDAIFEAKLTFLRESQRTPNCTNGPNPNGHQDDSTPEPSPDASRSSETSLEHQSRNNEDDIKQEIIGEDWVFNAQ